MLAKWLEGTAGPATGYRHSGPAALTPGGGAEEDQTLPSGDLWSNQRVEESDDIS